MDSPFSSGFLSLGKTLRPIKNNSKDTIECGALESSGDLPLINIYETAHEFIIEVAFPGVKNDDFDVALQNHILSVTHKKETDTDPNLYISQEFANSPFYCSFILPQLANEDVIDAKYEAGILKLFIPKKEVVISIAPRLIRVD